MIPTYEQCMLEVNQGRCTRRESEDGNFVIFNYRGEVEIKNLWNNVNVWCRGLIFDLNNTRKPVAVPFKKFWNVGQKPQTRPDVLAKLGAPVSVLDKADGSLGIVFWDKYREALRVSTRGSLESEQAIWATKWINDNIDSGELQQLRQELMDRTYLVEIIYAANRIVVKYDFAGLILLDQICNATQSMASQLDQLDLVPIPQSWRRAESFVPSTLTEFIERAATLPGMVEGFVVTYSNGLKVKIKGMEYIRLHRIRFDLTPKRIFELLSNHDEDATGRRLPEVLDGLLASVPDEFAMPVRQVAGELMARWLKVWDNVSWHLETAKLESRGERKRMALYAQANLPREQHAAYFKLLDEDEKQASSLAWNAVNWDDLSI